MNLSCRKCGASHFTLDLAEDADQLDEKLALQRLVITCAACQDVYSYSWTTGFPVPEPVTS